MLRGGIEQDVLLRGAIRDVERTLRNEEADALRRAIFAAAHEGRVHRRGTGQPSSGSGAWASIRQLQAGS